MSKIGKKNILIPKESSIKIEGANLTISGPKGTKKLTVNDKIFSSKLNESEFQIQPLAKKFDKKTSILWGTYRSLINNAICNIVGRPIPRWSVPKFLLKIVAALSQKNKRKIDTLLGDEYYCSKKLELLGFKARKTLSEMNETSFWFIY